MRIMVIWTWEPEQRNPMYKKRMKEGRLMPEGLKITSEWLDVQGGRGIALGECDDPLTLFQWSNAWNDLAKIDCFPVVEVLDDKGMKWA